MATAIENIDAQIGKLQRHKEEIELAEFTENELPRIAALLGKTYAYRNNCYSCPEKPSDYWDVFRKVVRVIPVKGAAWILFEECSIDRDGKPQLSIECQYARYADWRAGWKPCAAKEYEQERARVMREISSPDLYAAGLGQKL